MIGPSGILRYGRDWCSSVYRFIVTWPDKQPLQFEIDFLEHYIPPNEWHNTIAKHLEEAYMYGTKAISISTVGWVDDWCLMSFNYDGRNRHYQCMFVSEDNDVIWVEISDATWMLHNHDPYRIIRHKIQDALNARRAIRNEWSQFQGRGFW